MRTVIETTVCPACFESLIMKAYPSLLVDSIVVVLLLIHFFVTSCLMTHICLISNKVNPDPYLYVLDAFFNLVGSKVVVCHQLLSLSDGLLQVRRPPGHLVLEGIVLTQQTHRARQILPTILRGQDLFLLSDPSFLQVTRWLLCDMIDVYTQKKNEKKKKYKCSQHFYRAFLVLLLLKVLYNAH